MQNGHYNKNEVKLLVAYMQQCKVGTNPFNLQYGDPNFSTSTWWLSLNCTKPAPSMLKNLAVLLIDGLPHTAIM